MEERFWAKVVKTDTCWLWVAATDAKGYGYFRSHGDKNVLSHRLSYEWAHGVIPEGLEIDHVCNVRNCVNPEHLQALTTRENVLRSSSIPANNARKTHCIRGHELSGANLYGEKRGFRQCRACMKLRRRGLAEPPEKVMVATLEPNVYSRDYDRVNCVEGRMDSEIPSDLITPLAESAAQLHELYAAYLSAGFNISQALYLVGVVLQAAVARGT